MPRTYQLLLLFLFCLLLPACQRQQPAASITEARGAVADSMPLIDFISTYRLQMRSAPCSNVYLLDGGGVRISLYPDAPYMRLNDQLVDLPVTPFYEQGMFWIPNAVIALLPEAILARARPQPKAAPTRVVVLDPGHGGHNDGATENGLREADLNLDMARRVRHVLESQGVPVVMTREQDVFVELGDRAHVGNQRPGAVFLSLHFNQFDDPNVEGVETFVLRNTDRGRQRLENAVRRYKFRNRRRTLTPAEALPHAQKVESDAYAEANRIAEKIQQAVVQVLGASDRGVKGANFHVLRESYFGPAVLVEIGFISNRETARQVANVTTRDRIARAIAKALLPYLSK